MTIPDMTLRDWFAGQALAAMSISAAQVLDGAPFAHAAYVIADAMLAERALAAASSLDFSQASDSQYIPLARR